VKLRSIATCCLVCALVAFSAVIAVGQSRTAVTPVAAGHSPIPFHTSPSASDVDSGVNPAGSRWTKASHAPPVSVGAMLLLTDGRVLVHSEPNCSGCKGNYANWYALTPDVNGSYVNGTWKQVASMPSGYAPLFFGSAVLKDGKVVVQGGEYNCTGSCAAVWQSLGALYDPAANKWTSTTPPSNSNIGDAQSVVLADETWMLAQCCATAFGNSTFPVYYTFNENARTFTVKSNSSDGKFDDFDEEGWTLLPNGRFLTVDAYTNQQALVNGTKSETYNSATNIWTTAGSTIKQLWDSACGTGTGSFELGPAVLRPDGTVFATGASNCSAGHTAIYNSTTGKWAAGPDFASSQAANDSPAALEINGNVVVEVSPSGGTFSSPSKFYEWDGSNLTAIGNPPNALNTASYQGHLLALPNGQIMYTDYSTYVEFLTPLGTFTSSWQPTITSVPSTLSTGETFAVSGTQFNGLSEANAYGDDFQDATNYPLVQIVNNSSGHVFFAKTHDHSTMAIATGKTSVSTSFDVPAGMETGASTLFVIANGIPSAGAAVTVSQGSGQTPTSASLVSNPNPSNTGQSVTLTATVAPVNSPAPAATVNFTSNGASISGCSAVSLNASGVATCTTSFATTATYALVATYSGDANYSGSTSNTVQQVVKSGTGGSTTTLVSNKSPSTVNTSVKFAARVSPKSATGTVKFTVNNTTVPSCSAVTVTAAGTATCSVTFKKKGTFSVVGTYSGDGAHSGSTSNTVSQVVQ
jgi:hypothetical protein